MKTTKTTSTTTYASPGLAAYRRAHPASRATRWVRYTQNGSVQQRCGCVACGAEIDSCSGKWPKPLHWFARIREHVSTCPEIARWESSAAAERDLSHGGE